MDQDRSHKIEKDPNIKNFTIHYFKSFLIESTMC